MSRLYTNTQITGVTVATTSCVLSGTKADEHHVVLTRIPGATGIATSLHVDRWRPEAQKMDRVSCTFDEFVAWLEAR